MENKIVINVATPEDATGIVSVRRKTWIKTYPNEQEGITKEDIEAALNRRTVKEEISQVSERLSKEYNDKNLQTFVAKDNDQIIGFVFVLKKEEQNRIGAFYVLAEYQRQGVGSILMQRAIEWLGNDKEIYLEVATYNTPAINFYKKFGFVENGSVHVDVAKLPSGKEIPEMEMVRK